MDLTKDGTTTVKTACPRCGEADRLTGTASGDVITSSCGACGASWERDTTRRCRACGSDNLHYAPKPLWEKGRGEQ